MLVPDIAADFLVKLTGHADRQAARDLADMLDGLPLALEQAAAYIQAAGQTLAGYLALFRRRRADLLARGEPTGYSKTVASTWALAFDRLQHTAPTAVGLLRLLAFCAPEAIPLRLLLQPRPGLAERLRALCPGVRFEVAHGQMEERELERRMLGFVRGEADVLVCTSIIESGIDIPQANTLIV